MGDLLTDVDLERRHDVQPGWRCWFRCFVPEALYTLEDAETGRGLQNGEPFPAGPLHPSIDDANRWGWTKERQTSASAERAELPLSVEYLVALPEGEKPHANP